MTGPAFQHSSNTPTFKSPALPLMMAAVSTACATTGNDAGSAGTGMSGGQATSLTGGTTSGDATDADAGTGASSTGMSVRAGTGTSASGSGQSSGSTGTRTTAAGTGSPGAGGSTGGAGSMGMAGSTRGAAGSVGAGGSTAAVAGHGAAHGRGHAAGQGAPGSAMGAGQAMAAIVPRTAAEALALVALVDQHEIRLAEQARGRNVTGLARDYAMMMIAHHTPHLAQTRALQTSVGGTASGTAVASLAAMSEQAERLLARLSGDAYARACIERMVLGHQMALQLVNASMCLARDTRVRDHLAATRKTIQAHLDRARALHTQLRR